ncbi:hypothetical protein MY11210_008483 [Beauveria gryllotalpidicola]
MKPPSTALVLGIAVLGKCDGYGESTMINCTSSVHSTTSTFTSIEYAAYLPPTTTTTTTTTTTCTSTNNEAQPTGESSPLYTVPGSHSSESTPRHSSTSGYTPVGPTNSASASNGPYATPYVPLANCTTNKTVPILVPLEGSKRPSSIVPNEAIDQIDDEALGEPAKDQEGNPLPQRFGLEALQKFLDDLPYAQWQWPRLPEPGSSRPITHSPDEFRDTVCTGDLIDRYEERRASRHLDHFCNRWQLPWERLYASTSGKTTLFMCPFGGLRNCSLALYQAASAHLDRECGPSGTGYVHVRKLRIGRERPSWNVTFCWGINFAPLHDYRIDQTDVLVEGRLYEEWQVLNRRRQMRKELLPKDINEGNDAEP